jgi:ABC-type polysaccharide transport system, permease component
LSVVIVCSMVIDFLSMNNGLINNIIQALGFEKYYFVADPKWFRTIYIGSEIWSGFGIGAVIYIAAIAGIDPAIYEAGIMDGCNRFKAVWHITIPGIFPTMATMFILNAGNMFRVGFEKVFLLYTPTTYSVADVFSTYVYRRGIVEGNYSFSTAVGLFESLVALVLLLITNYASKKMSEQSLW